MIVDNNGNYMINENGGPVDITLLLDQPTCVPITIIGRPQERSPPTATGNIYSAQHYTKLYKNMTLHLVNDFDNTRVRVTINPGENTTKVSIPITDDDLLEDTEVFNVVFSIMNQNAVGGRMGIPKTARVTINSEDGK